MAEQDALALIQEGIAAAKAGNRLLAYPLLFEATEIDPTNELGWLWLAGVTTNTDEAACCFRRVLEINPTNERAQAGLTYLKSQMKQMPLTEQQ
jgi:tetratricopeptide (TPR) repeat protein